MYGSGSFHDYSTGKSAHNVDDGAIEFGTFQFQGKIFARKLGNTTFRIVIFQGAEQLYVRGSIDCRLLFGSAECFGYHLDGKYRTIVSSLATGLMSIETSPRSTGLSLQAWYSRMSSSSSSEWTEEDVLLGLDPLVNRLVAVDTQELADSISAIVIVKDSTSSMQVMDLLKDEISPKTNKASQSPIALEELSTATLLGSAPSDVRSILVPATWRVLPLTGGASNVVVPSTEIMVCGTKHVGKSTLMRYLVNVLLQQCGRVCLLDLDLGQPELTAPGFVSLSVLSKPMLGPSFSNIHLASPDWQEVHFLGTPSAKDKLNDIFHIAMLLFARYKFSGDPIFNIPKDHMSKITTTQTATTATPLAPIIINTHGWIEGPGLETLQRLVAAIQPSELIQIIPHSDIPIFSSSSSPSSPSSTPSPSPASVKQLPQLHPHTSLHLLRPAVIHSNYATIKSTEKRIMQTMSALGSSRTVYRVPWSAFRLHILDAEVAPSQIMYVLNASIVALVVDSTHYISVQQAAAISADQQQLGAEQVGTPSPHPHHPHPVDSTLPIFTMEPPPYISSYCVGLGIIVSIDMENRCFFLATNVPRSQLLDVNTLVKGQIELPVSALLATATPSTPYLTADSANAEGSSTLKVRTNLVRGKSN